MFMNVTGLAIIPLSKQLRVDSSEATLTLRFLIAVLRNVSLQEKWWRCQD